MIKSGWKTTEFWITVALVVMALLGIGTDEANENVQLVLVAAGVIATVAYSLSRGLAKSRAEVASDVPSMLNRVMDAGEFAKGMHRQHAERNNWLTEKGDLIEPWDRLSSEQRKLYEVFASESIEFLRKQIRDKR